MRNAAVIGITALLMTWPTGLTGQGTEGMLLVRVKAKRAAVVFLEEVGREQFGTPHPGIEALPRATPADTRRVTLDQKKLTFIPHVLAIERGTAVDFVNSDDLLHNIHLYRGSDMKTLHNFAIPLKGLRYSYKFDVPDEIIVLCDVHSEMSAYILVLPNKHFFKVEGNSESDMKGITPGSYVLKVWREGAKKLERTIIAIKPGVNTLTLGA